MNDIKFKDGDSIIYLHSPKGSRKVPESKTSKEIESGVEGVEGVEGVKEGSSDLNNMIQSVVDMGYERSRINNAIEKGAKDVQSIVDFLVSNDEEEMERVRETEDNLFDYHSDKHMTEGVSSFRDQKFDGMTERQIDMLRNGFHSNPEVIQPLLDQISQNNPKISEMIQKDPESFIRLFLDQNPDDLNIETEENGGDETRLDNEMTSRLSLTDKDKGAINRLCELGFDTNFVLQVYMACDKNEEVAADILFRDS